ncbi:MAG: hypothetical protein Q8R31_03865 [Candidatus Omnitrophota bacterium]|nr:hypothetical protein [Candidatus Omnitrophota bacterium]
MTMKKRPFHVVIVGILLLILSISGIIGRSADWRLLIYVPFFISSLGILFLKNWARILSILILAVFIIETAIILRNVTTIDLIAVQASGALLFLLLIYYLTRPKVQELFKK